jgi:hypothetical protein
MEISEIAKQKAMAKAKTRDGLKGSNNSNPNWQIILEIQARNA